MVHTPPAPDRRPHYDPATASSSERWVHTPTGYQQVLRPYAWLGQSGAIYGLDEKPSQYEGGGWGTLWAVVDSEPIAERPLSNALLGFEVSAHVQALERHRELRELTAEEEAMLIHMRSVLYLLQEKGLEVRWP